MKIIKYIFVIMVIISLCTMAFFACSNSKNKEGEEISIAALTVAAGADGLKFYFGEEEVSILYTVDDGEEQETLSGFDIYFEDSIGDHVVKAYVVNDAGERLAEGTFEYKTVKIELSELSVNGKTVSWTAAAGKVSVKEDKGSYQVTQESSYTTKASEATIYVKAESGFSVESAIYYVGDKIERSARVIPDNAEVLATPTLSFDGKTVNWDNVSNAKGYAVPYDDGEYSPATTATISDVYISTEGESVSSTANFHKIEVKALGDGVFYADSDPVVYLYEVLASDLIVTKTDWNVATLYSKSGVYYSSTDNKSFKSMNSDRYESSTEGIVYFRSSAFESAPEMWCSVKKEATVASEKISLRYCDCNSFGTILNALGGAGHDGWTTALSGHSTARISDVTAASFDTLASSFSSILDNYTITDRSAAWILASGSEAYSAFSAFFEQAKGLYEGSNLSLAKGLSYSANSGAIVGLNKDFTISFGSSRSLEDYRLVIARLFGYDDAATFGEYASTLAATYRLNAQNASALRISDRLKYDGAVYTASDSFLFPFVFKGARSAAVVAWLIVDADGVMSLWLSDVEAAFSAVNFADSSSFRSTEMTVYGRCMLFDTQVGKNYVADKTISVRFFRAATEAQPIEDGSAGQNDRWTAKKFVDGNWIASDVMLTLGEKYDGASVLCVNTRNDNVTYRISTSISLTKGYDHLSFWYLGDGISDVRIYLTGRNLSISRDLGVMPAYWVKVILRIDDQGWIVEGTDRSLSECWDDRDSVETMPDWTAASFSIGEILCLFSELHLTFKGNAPLGSATSHLIGDLAFAYDPTVADEFRQPLFALAENYVAFEEIGGESKNELLLCLNDDSTYSLYSTLLEDNFIITGNYRIDETLAALYLESSADFSLTLAFLDNGKTIVPRIAVGEQALHFSSDDPFGAVANLVHEFEEESEPLTDWSAYYYVMADDNWEIPSDALISYGVKNASGVLKLSVGKNQKYRFVYNEGGASLGVANYFSFDVMNDARIKVRAVATDVNGNAYYLLGGRTEYSDEIEFAVEKYLPAVSLREIAFLLEYDGEERLVDLFIDNLPIGYQAAPALFSGFPAPEIVKGEYALSFGYETSDAVLEYSFDKKTWTEGVSYAIPESSGTYTIYVRARIGSEYSKQSSYTFAVEKVYIDPIVVTMTGQGNEQRASWGSSNGIVSKKINDGEFVYTDENYIETSENVELTLRAEGYFDRDNATYYVGTVTLTRKILVDFVLDAPTIVPTQNGIEWAEVANADAYVISDNEVGEIPCDKDHRVYPFATVEGVHTLQITSYAYDDQGNTRAYSAYAEYTYRVKYITLSVTCVNDVVSWEAAAYQVVVSDNGAAVNDFILDGQGKPAYKVVSIGGHRVTVSAKSGFVAKSSDEDYDVYYCVRPEEGSDQTVSELSNTVQLTVTSMPTPVVAVYDESDGLYLYWEHRDALTGSVTTAADMMSFYKFLVYQTTIKKDEGEWSEWTDCDGWTYAFPQEIGSYAIRVRAKGNGANYRDSSESESYLFTVQSVSISLDTPEISESGSVLTYDYSAYAFSRKVGNKGSYVPTTEKSFSTEKTAYVWLKAVGGYDFLNHIYYCGDDFDIGGENGYRLVVPIKLNAPALSSFNDEKISWKTKNSLENLFYKVTFKNLTQGTEQTVSVQTAYIMLASYLTDADCDYTVEIVAAHVDGEQYPDSEKISLIYRTRSVALANVRYENETVTWTYTGKMFLSVDERASWFAWDKNEYANDNGGVAMVYLEARAGYDVLSANEIVPYRGATKEDKLRVEEFRLATPALTQSENALSWQKDENATAYLRKIMSIDSTAEDLAAAASSEEGWDTIASDVDEDWKSKLSFTITFDENDEKYVILKVIGNGGNVHDSEALVFGMRKVALSEVTVSKGVASWTKSGITTLQTYHKGDTDYSAYEEIRKTTYMPESNICINLRCAGGFDPIDGVYYFGKSVTLDRPEVEIIVPICLATPTVAFSEDEQGITLGSVTNADAYRITCYSGEELVYEDKLFDQGSVYPYESGLADRDIRLLISACSVENSEQYGDSIPAEFIYHLRVVSLSEIENVITENPDAGWASFTAQGLIFVKEGIDEPRQITGSTYTPHTTTEITIEARTGIDTVNAMVYVGSNVEKSKRIIVPKRLAIPSIREIAGATYLMIDPVENATKYLYSTDGGKNWSEASNRRVTCDSVSGEHTVRVKASAGASSTQYPDSPASDDFVYSTVAVALSDLRQENVITFKWDVVAYEVRVEVNNSGQVVNTTGEFTVNAAGRNVVDVYAYRGYSVDQKRYYSYSSASLKKSGEVTISKLSAPSNLRVDASSRQIVWDATSNAASYKVKVNNGTFNTQTSIGKALATSAGSYKVYVKAVAVKNTAYIDSDESLFEYTVKTVALSNITVVGSTASWTKTAYKTSISVDGGSYTQTSATTYTPTAEGDHTLKVKAEGGWDASGKCYYYASAAIEKTATVSLHSLAKPVLTATDKGITWKAVTNATSYKVKVDNGNYSTQTDRSVSFSTSAEKHHVYVIAVATANSGYDDSVVASFDYETKQTSFSFLTSSATMTTWIATALKVQYSTDNGTTFKDCKYSGYTATASGSVKFRALGGWDSAAKVYYNGTTSVQSKTFTLPGLAINGNFENGTGSWTRDVYASNGWESTTASSVTSCVDGYGAGSAIRLHSFLNGMSYRFSYTFGDLPGNYKSMSFDVRLNEYLSDGTMLRFQDMSGGGTYVDYSLNSLKLTKGVWYHVTVGFEDENLIINMGGTEYTAPKAKSLAGESKFYASIKKLDTVQILIKGSKDNRDCYTYFDNFQFSTATCSTATKTRITAHENTFADWTGWSLYKKEWGPESSGSYAKVGSLPEIISNKDQNVDNTVNFWPGYDTYKFVYNESGSSLGTVNHLSIDIGGDKNVETRYSIEIITTSGEKITLIGGGADVSAALASPNGISSLTTLSFNFTEKAIKSIIVYAYVPNGHLFMDNLFLTKLT